MEGTPAITGSKQIACPVSRGWGLVAWAGAYVCVLVRVVAAAAAAAAAAACKFTGVCMFSEERKCVREPSMPKQRQQCCRNSIQGKTCAAATGFFVLLK